MRFPRLALVVMVVLGISCSTKAKTSITNRAFDNDSRRQQLMEATLRVLDKHPEYVDEFYGAARKHPATLDRFLENTARDLREPALAKRVAAHLVAHIAGLHQIMIETLAAAQGNKKAMTAILEAGQNPADRSTIDPVQAKRNPAPSARRSPQSATRAHSQR